jgi:hypothetical protein
MAQKLTLLFVALAAAVLAGTYLMVERGEDINTLDMTCGFTDDFASFIKANGTALIM